MTKQSSYNIHSIKNSILALTRFEWCLWLTSLVVTSLSFLLPEDKDILTLIASLIGVTALIFVAKGLVIGQVLIVVFSVFYGIISFVFGYYGEMITYLGMSAPIAIFSIISWLRHPFKQSAEVAVSRLTPKKIAVMLTLGALVTTAFYFILGALRNENLLVSTLSVTTSFLAAYMTFLRSPFYALGYAANDIVLIILWVLAAIGDISYLPMVICFVMFLVNDLYGFVNWQRMAKRQRREMKENGAVASA